MNEEIQKRLAEGSDIVLSFIKQGAEAVAEQAPLLAQEVVMFGRAEAIIFAVMFAGFGIASFLFGRMLFDTADGSWAPDQRIMGRIIQIAGGLISTLFITHDAMIIAKTIFAPRLYILQILGAITK